MPRRSTLLASLWGLLLVTVGLVEAVRSPCPAPVAGRDLCMSVWEPEAAATLDERLDAAGYTWPPANGRIPAIEVTRFPADMATLTVDRKKAVFFRTLLPLVLAENARLREQRAFLERVLDADLPPADSDAGRRLRALAEAYGVDAEPGTAAFRRRMLRRVDVVPPALALAQAANESGWGTSRFARQGNSLFGQWTWEAGAGIRPGEAGADARHAVRAFPDLRASVRAYLHNLNAGFAYTELRRQRAAMRARGAHLDATALAAGLVRYSQRGRAYVEEIRAMIDHNDLDALPRLRLVSPSEAA